MTARPLLFLRRVFVIVALVFGVSLVSYQIQLNYGAYGFIVENSYRQIPFLTEYILYVAALTDIEAWRVFWGHAIIAWVVALVLFDNYLKKIGYDNVFACVLPLLTLGGVKAAFVNLDAVLFLMVVLCFSTVLISRKYMIALVPLLIVLSLIYPLKPSILRPYHVVNFFISFHVWLPLAFIGATRRPVYLKKMLSLLPFYMVIFALTVDWYRWVVMLGTIWVPLILEVNR